MKLPHQTSIPFLIALILCSAAGVHATDETYVFTPPSPYPPGDQHTFSGTIVLDTSSSTGGSISDIVSLSWSDNWWGGGGGLSVSTTDPSGICTINGAFTWNADEISSMDIASLAGYWWPAWPNGTYFPNWIVTGGGIEDWVTTDFGNGTWVEESPTVPDRWTTFPVLFLLFGTLVSFRQVTVKSLVQFIGYR